jgi:hypothetical protein
MRISIDLFVANFPSAYIPFLFTVNLYLRSSFCFREEREWREWVDNHFIHLISPNVYRTWNEALDTFYFFNQIGEWERNFPTWERYLAIYVGAAAMYLISKRLKKRFVYFVKINYNIQLDSPISSIILMTFLDLWKNS